MGRGPQQNPAFAKIFQKADRGIDLKKAWQQHGAPTTLKNIQRVYRKHQEVAAAAASATPAGASHPLSGGGAGVSKAAKTPVTRTGPSVTVTARQTSHQVEVAQRNKEVHTTAYVTVHKAATLEYAQAKVKGMLRTKGHTPAEIAARADSKLSGSNERRIVPGALKAAVYYKRAGASPKPPGPQPSAEKTALATAMKTYAKRKQLEGDTQKPKELSRKMLAAVHGTAYERLVNTPHKRKHMLKLLRQGKNALESTQGESVEKRRVDWLTYENVSEWFAGWIAFLEAKKFGVWKEHPALKKRMLYVRAREPSIERGTRARARPAHVPHTATARRVSGVASRPIAGTVRLRAIPVVAQPRIPVACRTCLLPVLPQLPAHTLPPPLVRRCPSRSATASCSPTRCTR